MSKKINKDTPALQIPKEIRELARESRKQRVIKEQADILEKQTRDTEQKRVRAARLKTGLKYATKIFLWAQEFRESNEGKELIKASPGSDLYFFNGQILGIEKVSLGISIPGLFWRNSGMGYSNQWVHSPENLAESVETKILKMASEWIDNGEVWECIKRRFLYKEIK